MVESGPGDLGEVWTTGFKRKERRRGGEGNLRREQGLRVEERRERHQIGVEERRRAPQKVTRSQGGEEEEED